MDSRPASEQLRLVSGDASNKLIVIVFDVEGTYVAHKVNPFKKVKKMKKLKIGGGWSSSSSSSSSEEE